MPSKGHKPVAFYLNREQHVKLIALKIEQHDREIAEQGYATTNTLTDYLRRVIASLPEPSADSVKRAEAE